MRAQDKKEIAALLRRRVLCRVLLEGRTLTQADIIHDFDVFSCCYFFLLLSLLSDFCQAKWAAEKASSEDRACGAR